METLTNGDRFVGWGAQPNLTEFSPADHVVFDAALADSVTSYCAFRFPWSATRSERPAIATHTDPNGKVTVYASWNGATDVTRWRILLGPSTQALKPLGDAPSSGLETSVNLSSSAAYVRAEAQSASGRVLAASDTIKTDGRAA